MGESAPAGLGRAQPKGSGSEFVKKLFKGGKPGDHRLCLHCGIVIAAATVLLALCASGCSMTLRAMADVSPSGPGASMEGWTCQTSSHEA